MISIPMSGMGEGMTQRGNEVIQPFFIVGAQRSGTTLLRLILNAHSRIAIPEEARFLMPLLTRRYLRDGFSGPSLAALIRYLSLSAEFKLWNYDAGGVLSYFQQQEHIALKAVIEALYLSYCKSEGKICWGDKSLFFRRIDILDDLFPDARYIHVVRDGRDVFDSWRKMDLTKSNVAVVAFDWRYKLYRIRQSFGKVDSERVLTIRYEDLIDSPENVVQSICSFISVKYEARMLDFYRTSRRYIGDHHSRLIFGAIDKTNAQKWRRTLSSYERKVFNSLAGDYLRQYGYEVAKELLTPVELAVLTGDMMIGIPRRVAQVVGDKLERSSALKKGRAAHSIKVGAMPDISKGSRGSNEDSGNVKS